MKCFSKFKPSRPPEALDLVPVLKWSSREASGPNEAGLEGRNSETYYKAEPLPKAFLYVYIISFNLHKLPKKPVLLSHIMYEKTEAQRVYH